MITKNSIKLIVYIAILVTAVFSGCVSTIVTWPQTYVKEQDPNNILILNPDGSAISSDNGANFAGKYRQDDNKITITWNFMGLVEFYTADDNNTLTGPEPKKYKWILSKQKSN